MAHYEKSGAKILCEFGQNHHQNQAHLKESVFDKFHVFSTHASTDALQLFNSYHTLKTSMKPVMTQIPKDFTSSFFSVIFFGFGWYVTWLMEILGASYELKSCWASVDA